MQFQIPQFIETEDKIVGPFSLRQFLYIGAAAGVCMILYFLLALWFWFVLSAFIMGFAILFAMVKINGQPFGRVFSSALSFYWQPQTYVWLPENPDLPKTEENLKSVTGGGFSLENIMAGMALKQVWHHVQTGTKESAEMASRQLGRAKEKYEIFDRLAGDRRIAKRVDYH